MKQTIFKVGVTGGIGSGKTEVCRMFEELGVPVLYADAIARTITEEDGEVKTKIRKTFGSAVFDSTGRLDRKKMASIVFSDEKAKLRLNGIVHPKVFESIDKTIAGFSHSSTRFVIIEAALIYETKMDKDLDYVIVVDAEREERIRRVADRDNISRNDVLKRMQAQMAVEEKLEKADFIIRNNGSREELRGRVRFIHNLISML
jgi:dephospho-CoA kinase